MKFKIENLKQDSVIKFIIIMSDVEDRFYLFKIAELKLFMAVS